MGGAAGAMGGPDVGDWVLAEAVVTTSKMTPPYEGPYIVTAVERDVAGVPTGWVKIAEILAGLRPDDVGYPARTKTERTVTLDMLIPFDHSRTSANEAYQWRLPAGWYTISEVRAGPDEAGMFEVKWTHKEDPTWVYPSVIDHSVAFQLYCERNGLDRKQLAKDQRTKALEGLKAKGKVVPVVPPGGRDVTPRAAAVAAQKALQTGAQQALVAQPAPVAGAQQVPKAQQAPVLEAVKLGCPVCGLEIRVNKAGVIDGRHKPCAGAGMQPREL